MLSRLHPGLVSPIFSIASQILLARPLQTRLSERAFSFSAAMGREADSIPHVDRTASEPRDPNLRSMRLAKVEEVNSTIRLFKLRAPESGVKVSCRLL